jgi:hypothetical protein
MSGLKGLAAFAVIASVSILTSAPAHAAECLGAQFPDSAKVGDSDIVLNGLGVRKATMFKVDVYVAGLYVPQKSTDGAAIVAANEPWLLQLQFLHDADASDVRKAFDDGFKAAAGSNYDALKPRIDALNAQMVDIEVGDVLTYAYDPAIGTVATVDGAAKPAVAGADFASALLAIDIGSSPPNQELKSGLLGGSCG